MLEETATTEELDNSDEEVLEVESPPTHPYDLPGEWFVLNAQSGHEKKVRTNILTRIKTSTLKTKSMMLLFQLMRLLRLGMVKRSI